MFPIFQVNSTLPCPSGYTCLPSVTSILNNPQALIISIALALVYGIAGYMNAVNTGSETFNKTMFVKTVVVSLVVGALMVYLGLSPTNGYAQALAYVSGNTVLMYLIDSFVNALFNLAGELKAAPVGSPVSG